MNERTKPMATAGFAATGTAEVVGSELQLGSGLMELAWRLYPICRSITGDGVRATFDILQEHIPLVRHEIPSGTRVFDWEIPPEWNIRRAWIRRANGAPVVDLADHTLHIVNYSAPFEGRLSKAELAHHVHTLPAQPDWIPHRTTYFRESWGFCMSQRQWDALPEGEYDVLVDSTLEPGALSLAECVIPGDSQSEILLSTHSCHPSMANDNLSGIVVLTALCQWLAAAPRRYTYRVVFAPGTIGSLSWLWQRQAGLERIRGGLVLSGLGDSGPLTYKRSRRGSALIDRIVECGLRDAETSGEIRDFAPYGYDERQYCAPGFDLPVGRLSRTPHGEYPEYHTSADDLGFIDADQLEGALAFCRRVVEDLEGGDRYWINRAPYGEPRLGKRGLYGGVSRQSGPDEAHMAMLWVLNLSDGSYSMLDIAERSGLPLSVLVEAGDRLHEAGLLAPATEGHQPEAKTKGEQE